MAPPSLVQNGQGFHPRKTRATQMGLQDDTPTGRMMPEGTAAIVKAFARRVPILNARSTRQTRTIATGALWGQRRRHASKRRSRLALHACLADHACHRAAAIALPPHPCRRIASTRLPRRASPRHADAQQPAAPHRCLASPAAAAGAPPRRSTTSPPAAALE